VDSLASGSTGEESDTHARTTESRPRGHASSTSLRVHSLLLMTRHLAPASVWLQPPVLRHGSATTDGTSTGTEGTTEEIDVGATSPISSAAVTPWFSPRGVPCRTVILCGGAKLEILGASFLPSIDTVTTAVGLLAPPDDRTTVTARVGLIVGWSAVLR
jgi:hypothetical protein